MSSSDPHSSVFVYGALRSGTTLLRLMLKGHPDLQSPGEADYLFDHIRRDPAGPGGWRYDRDALAGDRILRDTGVAPRPGLDGSDLLAGLVADLAARESGRMVLNVHRAAPVMAELFPDAPVIHLVRDPRDVARSSIGMGWVGTSYHGAEHWIATERAWDAAGIDPARVCEIRFETFTADPERELTKICDHLGLPFDAAMLDYHESSTYAPPDGRIAAKWKGRAAPREIALIEGRLGPLLEARGYEPAGAPATPGAVEALRLAVSNRLRRWRYNIRRYGLPLFAGHHAARLLRLRGLERRLAKRQEAIVIRNRK